MNAPRLDGDCLAEREVALIEKAALSVGMKSLMNHGAASCVYSEGCNGVTQEHLIAFAREVAVHCVAALSASKQGGEAEGEAAEAARGFVAMAQEAVAHWDADRDMKVGKILHAMAGYSQRYDRRADSFHATFPPAPAAQPQGESNE